MLWLPPFGKDDVKVVYETPHRIAALQYSEDCQTLFLTRTVDNHILKLRQKLEKEPTNPVHFRTVHGVGYKFVR